MGLCASMQAAAFTLATPSPIAKSRPINTLGAGFSATPPNQPLRYNSIKSHYNIKPSAHDGDAQQLPGSMLVSLEGASRGTYSVSYINIFVYFCLSVSCIAVSLLPSGSIGFLNGMRCLSGGDYGHLNEKHWLCMRENRLLHERRENPQTIQFV